MLLEPGDALEGFYTASIHVRPQRYAFVIPAGDVRSAINAVRANCLLWGGSFNLLVPAKPTEGILPEWRQIFRTFDPDVVIDVVGLPEADLLQLKALRQRVTEWRQAYPPHFAVRGCLIYSILVALERMGAVLPVLYPDLAEDDPLYLPMLARWGAVDDDAYDELRGLHSFVSSLRYSTLAPVAPGTWDDQISMLSGAPPRAGPDDATSPLLLTRRFLPFRPASHSLVPGPTPERPQSDEAFYDQVIVTGQHNDMQDLCLYWALRRPRPFPSRFPLWLPLEVLGSDTARVAIEQAQNKDPARSMFLRVNPLAVVSCSATESEIHEALRQSGIEAQVHTTELHRFFLPRVSVGPGEEVELRFEERQTRLRAPRLEFGNQLVGNAALAVDVRLPRAKLPQVPGLANRMYGNTMRVSADSIVLNFDASRPQGLLEFDVPRWWPVLESLVAHAGFRCQPSDKSHIAFAIIELLGGLRNLEILASSRIFDLFVALATAPRSKSGQELPFVERVRPDWSYAQIEDKLTRSYADTVVQWLLKHNILIRGARVHCPRCRLEKWYAAERLMPRDFTCDGCFTTMPTPLELNNTNWRYRLNELFVRGLDQGILPVLLTMLASADPTVPESIGTTLGFFPGIVLKRPKRGKVDSLHHVEVDFIEVFDGRLIIGECKVNAKDIAESQLQTYGRLAAGLNCSRIVIASIVPLDDDAKARIAGVLNQIPVHIDWIATRDLQDRTWSQRRRAERGISEEADLGDAEQLADRFLQHLVTYYLSERTD